MNVQEKYRREMDALVFSHGFEERTRRLMAQAAGKEPVSMTRRKIIKIIAAAAAAIMLLTGTAFAFSALLTPSQVAQQVDEGKGSPDIAQAFESEDAVYINQTLTVGDYIFTLLGITSADRLDFINDLPEENRHSYIVLAAERADGVPFKPEDGLLDRAGRENLSITPLVEGWAPHVVNAWSLDCSGHGLTVDGVRYYLFDYTNLELFADRTVYLAIYEGLAPSPDRIVMYDDGTIGFAPTYTGEGAMFTLPVDPSRADPEAAAALLEERGWDEHLLHTPTAELLDEEAEQSVENELSGGETTTIVVESADGKYSRTESTPTTVAG